MRNGRSGQALLIAILVVLIVAFAAALIFAHYTLQTRISLQQSRQIRLIALNDAALAEALAHLAENEGFRGEGPHEFADGEISSVVRSLVDGRREILATAIYRGWTRRTRLEVTMVAGGPRVDSWALDRGN